MRCSVCKRILYFECFIRVAPGRYNHVCCGEVYWWNLKR